MENNTNQSQQTDGQPSCAVASGSPYRGSRCGVCYWALYDGDWCQNKDCKMSGKSVGKNKIRLSNDEAQILIKANPKLTGDSPV